MNEVTPLRRRLATRFLTKGSLRWRNLTTASHVMLPTYATAFTLIGIIAIIQDPSRTSSPFWNGPKSLLGWTPDGLRPIQWWGIIFLTVALVEWSALLRARRREMIGALSVGAGMCAFWCCISIAAAIYSPLVSYTSCVWIGVVVMAHFASTRSVRAGER